MSSNESVVDPTPPSPEGSTLRSSRTPSRTPSPPSSSQYGSRRSSSHSHFGSVASRSASSARLKELNPNEGWEEAKEATDDDSKICQVRLEFLNRDGVAVASSRSTSHPELVSILQAMIRSETHVKLRNSCVSKLIQSSIFQSEIQNQVILHLSRSFSNFLSSRDCAFRNQDLFKSDLEELLSLDLNDIFMSVTSACPEFVNQLCVLCFNATLKEVLEGINNKFEKQRIFAILSIAAFTRNQKANIFQKIFGNFCKKKNTSKQCLQLLQRIGVSLVPPTLRADEDKLGSTFMNEVTQRKVEVEEWSKLREFLEEMSSIEEIQEKFINYDSHRVKFYK